MTRQEAFKKVWNYLEKDQCNEAEKLAQKYDIEINYYYADEGKIYVDDECLKFNVNE